MSVVKVGLLTFHRCINYGSYWQARSLAEGLMSRGHNAEILDHYSKRVNIAEWKVAFRPVLPNEIPKSDHPLYKEKILGFFEAFEQLPLSKKFPLDEPEQMDPYDIVVVGSDEVWNLFHPWYGKCPLFYGKGVRAKRLISYAASFGNYPATWGIDQNWSQYLQEFDMISVRDANSMAIIKNSMGIEPELVLDPCLQFNIQPDEQDDIFRDQSYVAVYGHNFSDTFIHEIRNWAKHRNLLLVSIGYRNDWADEQWLTADPHQFAQFMANAEAVATNFFHGCVFALRNKKPFVCETSSYRSQKVQGLMTKVGGEEHLVTEETVTTVYNNLLNEPLSSKILKKIEMLRQISNEYLDRSLDLKKLQYA